MIRKAIAALRTTTTYPISTRTFQGNLFGYYTDDHFRWWLPAERAGWDGPSFIHYWKDKCWGGCFGTPNPALYTRPPKPDRYASLPSDGKQEIPKYWIPGHVLARTPGERPDSERNPEQPAQRSRWEEMDDRYRTNIEPLASKLRSRCEDLEDLDHHDGP